MKGRTGRYNHVNAKERNIGGIKVPQYGTNTKITGMAEGKSTGIQTDGQSGIQRYDRPGRKWGGKSENSRQHEHKKDNDEHEWHEDGYKSGGFLAGMKKGALHKEMGVKEGEKIPAKKLAKAAHSDNPTLRRRAILAQTMKKWHHGG
jgi:hypothetical protein